MPTIRPFVFMALAFLLTAPVTAAAQSFQTGMDCAAQYSRCERNAESSTHGTAGRPAACAAYARCQAKAQCRASKCICDRTHGSADPALAHEATAICYAVVSPHGANGCDRYGRQCAAAMNAAAQHPDTSQTQPGRADRFR